MSRLFLSSSFAAVAGLLPAFTGESLNGRSVTFIPTASIPEKVTFYVKAGRKALEKLGLIVDELDISTASLDEIKRKLDMNDFIYVTGGNTFFLLQELRRTGADILIKRHIQDGKYYIGESAGSMILSPSIEYAKGMDDCSKAPALHDTNALHAIDFHPLPHHTNVPFKKTVEKIIAQYGSRLKLNPISNEQVITVNGDRVDVQPALIDK